MYGSCPGCLLRVRFSKLGYLDTPELDYRAWVADGRTTVRCW